MQSKAFGTLVALAIISFIVSIICAVKANGETGYFGDPSAAASFAAASNVFLIWAGVCIIALLAVAAIDHSLGRITLTVPPDRTTNEVLPPVTPRAAPQADDVG